MIKIKGKEHSIQLINQLQLNCMPQDVIDRNNEIRIKRFFEENPASEYIVRDVFTPMGKYCFVSSFEECLDYLKTVSAEKFSISVSFRNVEGRILLGDIYIKENYVSLSASTNPNANHRNIYEKPEISLNCELFDNRLWDVPGFEKLIEYINKFNLYELVIEFAIFRNKLGTQHDNVVIIELRSDY